MQNEMREIKDEIASESREAGREIDEAVDDIDTDKIKKEMKEASESISGFAGDSAITAKIKTELAATDGVPALSIDVDTNDRVVTLSGTVSSSEQIGKAVEIAKSVEGVRKVISTVQIDSEAPAKAKPEEPPESKS